MAKLKTTQNDLSVNDFLNAIADEKRRKDCFTIAALMKQVTKKQPRMWGTSIVGFGSYHYKYDSGHEGDSCLTGFSPRKQNLTLYLMGGFDRFAPLMKKLGKYKTSGSCLHIKMVDDISLPVLKRMVAQSVKYVTKKYT